MLTLIFINKLDSVQSATDEYVRRGYTISSSKKDNHCLRQENDGTYSNYKFQVEFAKQNTVQEKVMLGIKAFCETFFSFGFGLISQRVRNDWEKAFCSKKVVQLYVYDRPIFVNPSLKFF